MEEILKSFLGGAGGAAIIAGLFSIWQWFLNRNAKKEDQAVQQKADDCKARGEDIARVENQVKALYKANRIQMYDRIKHLGKAYIAAHEISSEDLEDLIDMHKCYHDDLGGNGFLDEIMEQVRHLPIKP